MSEPVKSRGMSGKDVITVGIFSAIYFVINFAFMLLGGLHPLLWILMPGFIALFTGIPYLMMCAKVQKVGSVLLMGLITGLIYYVTGQFTVVILVSFVLACGLAEITRVITHYRSMAGNLVSFVLFSVGMVGSPLPIWLMREDFLRQITEQGMPADYVNTLAALSSNGMLIVLFLAPVVGAIIGGILARAMFRKHFEKAGLCFPQGSTCIPRPVLFRPPRRGGGDHRTQRRGQDHPFPLPLRAAERTSGTNSAEWKASGSKRPPAVGFLCHAGCKPSTVLRQRVGRVPDVRAGGI